MSTLVHATDFHYIWLHTVRYIVMHAVQKTRKKHENVRSAYYETYNNVEHRVQDVFEYKAEYKVQDVAVSGPYLLFLAEKTVWIVYGSCGY